MRPAHEFGRCVRDNSSVIVTLVSFEPQLGGLHGPFLPGGSFFSLSFSAISSVLLFVKFAKVKPCCFHVSATRRITTSGDAGKI